MFETSVQLATGATVAGATVAGATVAGATLAGATVARATLAGATIAGATLAGATVAGATVAGATVAGAPPSCKLRYCAASARPALPLLAVLCRGRLLMQRSEVQPSHHRLLPSTRYNCSSPGGFLNPCEN